MGGCIGIRWEGGREMEMAMEMAMEMGMERERERERERETNINSTDSRIFRRRHIRGFHGTHNCIHKIL